MTGKQGAGGRWGGLLSCTTSGWRPPPGQPTRLLTPFADRVRVTSRPGLPPPPPPAPAPAPPRPPPAPPPPPRPRPPPPGSASPSCSHPKGQGLDPKKHQTQLRERTGGLPGPQLPVPNRWHCWAPRLLGSWLPTRTAQHWHFQASLLFPPSGNLAAFVTALLGTASLACSLAGPPQPLSASQPREQQGWEPRLNLYCLYVTTRGTAGVGGTTGREGQSAGAP